MGIINTKADIQISGKGPLKCKIAFVGEAPGTSEIKYGEPFVGRTGKLLNDLLRTTGIVRSNCYLTNVIK